MTDRTRLLVVGANSLIAGQVLAQVPESAHAQGCSHVAWQDIDLGSFDAVLNCAFDPDFYNSDRQGDGDLDTEIARACAERGVRFVMLSSRKVYAPNQGETLREDSDTVPDSAYGRNKLGTERALAGIAGLDHTILRLSNVFSFEPGRHTFFGTALRTLKEEGQITLDISPLVARDFISLGDCTRMIWRAVEAGMPGTFNVGRGVGTQLGHIAMWLIGGFGCGEVRVVSDRDHDSFVFDITAYREQIGEVPLPESVEQQCINIGRRLAQWKTS